MILNTDVSGKLSAAGIVLAGMLAAVVLPAWAFGQAAAAPPPPSTPPTKQAAAESEKPAGLPTPGPERDGIRVRLIVESERVDDNDEFRVRVDLINVSDNTINLSGDWPHHRSGTFPEYVKAAAGIRTDPDIMLWGIQTMATRPPAPRSDYTLASGETLTVEWTSQGRRLKTGVIFPNTTRNPYFPVDGLFRVTAEIPLFVQTPKSDSDNADTGETQPAARRKILLRSNEQLVSIGGSTRAPKATMVKIGHLHEDGKSCNISAGQLSGAEKGDAYLARTGMGVFWKLTVTEVHDHHSVAEFTLQPIRESELPRVRPHEKLTAGRSAALIPLNVKDTEWMWVHH